MVTKLWIILILYSIHVEGSDVNITVNNTVNNTFKDVGGTIHGSFNLTRADGPYLVTEDLIVAPYASLTIEAGSELHFRPAVGLTVYGTLLAKGAHSQRITFRALSCNQTQNCTNSSSTEYYSQGIRLVDGIPFRSGRLEVQWNGQWGTICDYYWDHRDTEVACRQLGFLGAKRHYRHPAVSGPIWLKDLWCSGNEQSLWDCSYHYRIGQTGCGHYRDVGIECDTLPSYLKKAVFWKGIMVASFNSSSKEQGRAFLENVDMISAAHVMNASKKLPELSNVTITDCISGLQLSELEAPLNITNTVVNGCRLVGINITSKGTPVQLHNVTVRNTTHGDGFVYKMITEARDFCSTHGNETSFPLSLKFYGDTTKVNCTKIFKARQDRKLVVHFRLIVGSDFELNVTDRSTTNATVLVNITKKDHGKVLKTSASSLIEISLLYRRYARVKARLEFIVVEEQDSANRGEEAGITISESTFTANADGGIDLHGTQLGNVIIEKTVITKTHYPGIHAVPQTIKRLSILNCTFSEIKYGIQLDSFSGDIAIENTLLSNPSSFAIQVDQTGIKTMLLKNVSVINSGGYGIRMLGYRAELKLIVTNSFFGWNKGITIHSYNSWTGAHNSSSVFFKQNTFLQNQGPVIEIERSTHLTNWLFEENSFVNNTEPAVLVTPQYTSFSYSPSVFLTGNHFTSNLCQGKSVIDVRGNLKQLILEGNRFIRNEGRSLKLLKSFSSALLLRNNIFDGNNCSNNGVLEVTRMEKSTTISENVFRGNTGLFVVRLQLVYDIDTDSTPRQNFTFMNNTLVNNTAVSLSNVLTCQVNISGLLDYKLVRVKYNTFNSPSFAKEVCANIPAASSNSMLNMSFNSWGYYSEQDIWQRVLNNHEFVLPQFQPFIITHDTFSQDNKTMEHSSKSLYGQISHAVRLTSSHSPYLVTSDVTILQEAVMSVDAGVQVQMAPGVSILVLGSLYVLGRPELPVKFTLLRKANDEHLSVRLKGGHFPWQGRLEILKNGTWMPLCSNNSDLWKKNNTKVACRQLGYGHELLSEQNKGTYYVTPTDTKAWPFSIHCLGNEVTIEDCPVSIMTESCDSSSHFILQCKREKLWGNIRFARDTNATVNSTKSRLEHLQIEYCGNHLSSYVPAIEAIQYVPELRSVDVSNCIAGGVKVVLPERSFQVINTTIHNSGGNGTELQLTRWNITLDKMTITSNEHGLLFSEPNRDTMSSLHYGQIMICSPGLVVNVTGQDTLLFFSVPYVQDATPTLSCSKRIVARHDEGLSVKLFQSAPSYISVFDNYGSQVITNKYTDQRERLIKGLLIPFNTITVTLNGNHAAQMLLQVTRLKPSEIPCTFERGTCGWKDYTKPMFENITLNRNWYRGRSSGWNTDHTYSTRTGHVMVHGYSYYPSYGALVSSPILKQSNYCNVEFYYKLRKSGFATLSVFIEDVQRRPGSVLKPLWTANQSAMNWKKMSLELPRTIENFTVIFLGYHRGSWYYDYRFIFLDDILFRRCEKPREHKVMGSTFSGNRGHGIRYTSTLNFAHLLRVERCVLTKNAMGSPSKTSLGALHINATNQAIQLYNNYIAENRNGGIYVKLQNDIEVDEAAPVTKPRNSHLHGNTIEANRGGALAFEGIERKVVEVHVTRNYISRNLGTNFEGTLFSVCNAAEVVALLEENHFYNNSGRYIVEYHSSHATLRALKFLRNTLYHNRGMGINYGITILCNGAAELHGNLLQNPDNRFQISTTLKGADIITNATSNWWGTSEDSLIAGLIRDRIMDPRLSVTVLYKPVLQAMPLNLFSVSCPPEWMSVDPDCVLYKGGALPFWKATSYCQRLKGSIIPLETERDKSVIEEVRRRDSTFQLENMTLWTVSVPAGMELPDDFCPIITENGDIGKSLCEDPHSFVCINRVVKRCPNSCFHNGKCIGATCFCYRGWTGADCSRFHCKDLHECSGRGECIGPNVCKCLPGFLGRGCTFSYCGKYENCSDCVTDPFCGWCDSLKSCTGGFARGPIDNRCPDWFYHHCYTVGRNQQCSSNIQSVDCEGKYCNFQEGKASTESCQKCKDLERCYKHTEEGKCRAWNETLCPGGDVNVDYTDSKRADNVELARNVKLIDPNVTLIYACPVQMEEEIEIVFVAPRELELQTGDILCSSQAGGIMHKVVKNVVDGPYKLVVGVPSRLEDVIDYADYKKEATVESTVDDITLEDEPDIEDLEDIISGNITLNTSQLFVLSAEASIYKCLGHTYEIENELVHSFYLVIEKKNLTNLQIGDILLSNTSQGWIETVERVSNTTDAVYIETKLQRCSENTELPKERFTQSRKQFSTSMFCTGGDNNPGMIISSNDANGSHFAVNDSIVGRASDGFIAKVVQVHPKEDFTVIEVVSASVGENRSITTGVEVNKLLSHHRRTRRSTDRYTRGVVSFNEYARKKILSSYGLTVEGGLSLSFGIEVFVEIEKEEVSREVKDASVGLIIRGSLRLEVDFKVSRRVSYSRRVNVMRKKQLGKNIYIKIAMISIPAGFFLSMTGSVTASVSGSLTHTVWTGGSVALGGECRWSSGCSLTHNKFTAGSNWDNRQTEVGIGADLAVTVTPRISFEFPVTPRWLGRLFKYKWFSPLKKLVGAIKKKVDLSLSLSVSAPFTASVSMVHPSSECDQVDKPASMQATFGMGNLICTFSVTFVGKSFKLPFKTDLSAERTASFCTCPIPRSKYCIGTTTARPTHPPTPSPTKKPRGRGSDRRGNRRWDNDDRNYDPSNRKVRRSPCGKEPCCAGSRRGPGCSQPDFWPEIGCSSNGIPLSTFDCGAICRCLGGWRGSFCDVLIGFGGGDPHLATLDGITYDFFGIGEFWGCKSVPNDFGFQYRFFHYERASLIGGVALKAGRSIVTVMTVKTQDPRDPPILRIDGIQMNLTQNSSSVAVDNDTVLLDYQKSFNSSSSDENGVVLISLQYESGVRVTIDVRQSQKMGRQYLNVAYSPTVAYTGQTAGLCGFMDNDPSNDFTGPSGIIYNNAVHFAESWRANPGLQGSGTRDSWSWNASNFFHEDIMDLSYTNPSYVPLYSLDGISQSVLMKANLTCQALGISDSDLQNCIFDVAVTNDTSFADQEEFKHECPDQCSGKGRCINGTCRCIEGWSGESCDRGSCLNCSTLHGQCVKSFCECDMGWEGRACDVKATCHNVNNCTDSFHGVCKTTDVCQCNPGFTGFDCSIIPTCHNVSNCSGNGVCIDFDVCKCNIEWSGVNCTEFSCAQLDFCSDHGRCVGLYKCMCDHGWTGASCALPDCSDVNQCSEQGECVSSNVCHCFVGYHGPNCSQALDCEAFSNCSGQGACVSKDVSTVFCRCYDGFSGPNCSVPTCAGVSNCSGHGDCIEADLCDCHKGYSGDDCNNVSCEALNFCSGNGECIGFDVCRCNSSWSGPACSVPDCSGVNQCSNQGDCILPDTCACYPSYDGISCDQKAKRNAHAPTFDRAFYDATIAENAPVGTVIFQVQANDSDSGRNGQLMHTILDGNEVDSRFIIDGITGNVSNLLVFDYEKLKQKTYNVTIMATDNGFPQKSATTVLRVTVTDENDNCPTFTEPFPNHVFEVDETQSIGGFVAKVSAVDLDSGINGAIVYDISTSDMFSIDPDKGLIIVASNLSSATYDLTVTARDGGDPFCATDTRLVVRVGSFPTVKPSITTSAPDETSTSSETLLQTTDANRKTQDLPTGPSSTVFGTMPASSSRPLTIATAVPQEGINVLVVACSAGGGLLVLIVIAVIVWKLVSRARVKQTQQRRRRGIELENKGAGKFNEVFELEPTTE